MKITNLTTTTLQISDPLPHEEAQHYQDGIKNVVIGATGTKRTVVRSGSNVSIPNDYRTVPNLNAAYSLEVKALLAAGKIAIDRRVEPDGTDTNPENDVNGPIVGMAYSIA